MQLPPGHKRVKFGGFLWFGGRKYTLKQLTPFDFVGEKNGIPFGIFSGAESEKTMWDRAKELSGMVEDTRDKEIALLRNVLRVGVVSFNGEPFDVDTYMARDSIKGGGVKEAMNIFARIILMTFNKFKLENNIEKNTAISIDIMAKRYGIAPIDVLFPGGGYTEMDAYMFNSQIAFSGVTEDNRRARLAAKK